MLWDERLRTRHTVAEPVQTVNEPEPVVIQPVVVELPCPVLSAVEEYTPYPVPMGDPTLEPLVC